MAKWFGLIPQSGVVLATGAAIACSLLDRTWTWTSHRITCKLPVIC